MAVRPISVCWLGGMLMPAIRAIALPRLALTLLVTRIRADHPQDALAPDDLALAAHLLDRSIHFHRLLLARQPGGYLARNTILALDRSYGVSSTVTLSPGRMRM